MEFSDYIIYVDESGDHSLVSIVFASKQSNSTGMQIADLIARPIGLKTLRPEQGNHAYDIIERKIWSGADADAPLYGLKVFP